MSALPPKADIDRARWDVRFVPKADICSAAKERLFDHFGERIGFPFRVHDMLQHACGYAPANAGHDTRGIQDWLGKAPQPQFKSTRFAAPRASAK